jgi:hypothetical protein
MPGMTPEEAENFYVEDEEAEPLFAAYDAARAAYEAEQAKASTQQAPAPDVLPRVLASGLYGNLRADLLPDESMAGSNTTLSVQA